MWVDVMIGMLMGAVREELLLYSIVMISFDDGVIAVQAVSNSVCYGLLGEVAAEMVREVLVVLESID